MDRFGVFSPIFVAMISFLRGEFVVMTPAYVHIDVQGVGYEVQISLHTYTQIQHLKTGLLQTHLLVREDGQQLYGFFDQQEKELFVRLISVSGVGAATARVMLSAMKPEELARAIVQGNAKLLEGIKGIGKKSAERIILELRDKLGRNLPQSNNPALIYNTLEQDALNALLALGIHRSAAEQAIKKVLSAEPSTAKLEDLVKKVLKIV
jgi:Holliday junction DNA helicase RuvA